MRLADPLEAARRVYDLRAADLASAWAALMLEEDWASVVHREIERDAHLVEQPRGLPRPQVKAVPLGEVAHRLRILNRRRRAAGQAALERHSLGNEDVSQGVEAGFESGGHDGSIPVADAPNGTAAPTPSESKKGPRK